MASLSLPRVLQLKKNSLDAEREHFEKFQTLAIQKAINSVETPVKEKHVRSTIIGTFQEQSAITYWMVAIRLPLQDNRIVAWKFCHVTHKLLREGHPACLDDSQRHIGMIENLGKLWVHLREGYGRLVHLYCTLLVCKLKFHARNPRLPGNMQVTADELDSIAENDVNNYFQLCVELFDYMDDILTLQAAVFDSLGNARANSMTASGQCRLAALIPCAQDASHIYDCNVRLLFRLHASLPPDTLAGHRERFRQQFKKLSSFYKHASSLQYYRNLLTLPVLPSNPPNFLLQSDFGTYVTPVVSIPEPPPDELDGVGSLIDTSDTISQATTPDNLDLFETSHSTTSSSPQPDPVVERDRLIDHLQNELKRMRSEVSQLVQERNNMLGSMREHCTRLESQLHSAKSELDEEKQKSGAILARTPEIQKKLAETEEKAKLTDEKFQKLKGAYTQLREEHITLIRQKAEVDKVASSLRAAAAQHESAKMLLQQQLNDRLKDVELLQQSTSSSEEIEAYKNEIANLRCDLENSRQKEVELETLKASMETLEIEHKTATTEQQEKLALVSSDLKESTENLQKLKQEKEDQEKELIRVKEELIGLKERSGDEYKKAVEEKEAALKQVSELTHQYQQEKEEQDHYAKNLEFKLLNLQKKFSEAETRVSNKYEEYQSNLNLKRQEFEECLSAKDKEIEGILEKLELLNFEYDTYKANISKEMVEVQSNLQESLIEVTKKKETLEAFVNKLRAEVDDLENKNQEVQKCLEDATAKISILSTRIEDTEQIGIEKDRKIKELQETLNTTMELKNKEMHDSQEKAVIVSDLHKILLDKECELEDLKSKLEDIIDSNYKERKEFEECQKESTIEITILKDKLQNVISCKDKVINDLKNMIGEKDDHVISLNVEVNKLAVELARLKEELTETRAELEIGQNELLTLRDERDRIVNRTEANLALKNQELQSLHDEINQLNDEKAEMLINYDKVTSKIDSDKQVSEKYIRELEEIQKQLYTDIESVRFEQSEMENKLNLEIERLRSECEQLRNDKENEVDSLTEKMNCLEADFNEQIILKDKTIAKSIQHVEELKNQLIEKQKAINDEKEKMALLVLEKEKDSQMAASRLERAEESRLTAECELQDLLQNNTALEADLAALRIQLEEAQAEAKKHRSRLVSCAGEAALEVTAGALAAAEHASAQDANKTAAEHASRALDLLARHAESVQGNEETVAKSAISVAHNTAQLASYAIEVSNISTDMEVADKLQQECKNMLVATKQCLESVCGGAAERAACAAARAGVAGVARAAAAADRAAAGARCVDDELADMDRAIEDAAAQIEELLAASRAGDSGVKLEVNGKILDACTALMGAVKVLVQDARRLQSELGDPIARQKMYRRNPQWSEGLISAAKAVVFAAKLLVTSADEAVGSEGRAEGVSAAAHEVAGSTAQLVAASRARAPPQAASLARLTAASRSVAAATGAVVAAVRAASALVRDREALDTSALTLTATRRLEMESKVRSLELESALEAERVRLAALRKRHYTLAQLEENGNMTNGKE